MIAKLYKNIKYYRELRGWSQAKLAKMTNYDRSMIAKIESGSVDLSRSKILKFAEVLNVSPADLMGLNEETNLVDGINEDYIKYDLCPNVLPLKGKTKKIPLLGEIACGEPIYANREYELYKEIDEMINADFCLKAKGDSMIGARIEDGDIVFIKECPEVYNGEIAAVIIDDSVTLKRVYYNKKQKEVVLNAENNAYPPLVYRDEELAQIRILGKAIGFQSVIK